MMEMRERVIELLMSVLDSLRDWCHGRLPSASLPINAQKGGKPGQYPGERRCPIWPGATARPWTRSVHLLLSPLELIRKLDALVPPPRLNFHPLPRRPRPRRGRAGAHRAGTPPGRRRNACSRTKRFYPALRKGRLGGVNEEHDQGPCDHFVVPALSRLPGCTVRAPECRELIREMMGLRLEDLDEGPELHAALAGARRV
jgi:hypothetical protein